MIPTVDLPITYSSALFSSYALYPLLFFLLAAFSSNTKSFSEDFAPFGYTWKVFTLFAESVFTLVEKLSKKN